MLSDQGDRLELSWEKYHVGVGRPLPLSDPCHDIRRSHDDEGLCVLADVTEEPGSEHCGLES